MAVILIGAVVVAAGAIYFGVSQWRRSHRRVLELLGVPTTSPKAPTPIHPEFALVPSGHSGPSGPSAVGAATSTQPPPAPTRASYYAQAPPNRAKGRPMGWYSVNGDYRDERYWDGRMWTARRQMVAGIWSTVPVGAD